MAIYHLLALINAGSKRLLVVLILSVLSMPSLAAETAPSATIVLIIDDMGNNLELGLKAIALPGPVNYAFLPHSPHGQVLANKAHRQHKEILLHAPMSNLRSHATGPGTLKPRMNRQQFLTTLHEDLASVPHVRGLNNHMGSLLTQLRQPMSWLMSELKQRQLYFVDSRTSPRSIAASTALSQQLPSLQRDVFLDNNKSFSAIDKQFKRLITLAKNQGLAVAIGHPYPETLEYLQQALPTLAAQGISLSLASRALANTACTSQTRRCKDAMALADAKR